MSYHQILIISLWSTCFVFIGISSGEVSYNNTTGNETITEGTAVDNNVTTQVTVSYSAVKTSVTKRDVKTTSQNQEIISNSTVTSNPSVHDALQQNTSKSIFLKPDEWNMDSGALVRTFYVVIGVTGVLLAFFVLRAVRMRSRNLKSRKYGVISTPTSALELEPLERATVDEDEEDTYFDVHQINRTSQK